MDIFNIIKENLPEGIEITDKTLKAIEKEVKAEQGKEFIPKEQYAKKTDKILELESDIKELQGKSTDADAYKQKLEDLQGKYDTDIANKQKEYDDFKASTESEKILSKKREAAKKLLRDKKVNDDVLDDFILDKLDYESMELDGNDVKDADNYLKSYQELITKYSGNTTIKGAQVATPPANNQSSYTIEDVKKMSAQDINKNWDKIKNTLQKG